MKTKIIKHNKIEQCRISKKPIDTSSEDYAILVECSGTTVRSVGFYKHELMKELVTGNLQKVRKEIIQRHTRVAAGLLNNLKEKMSQLAPGMNNPGSP